MGEPSAILTAEDLLAGTAIEHEVEVPAEVLHPTDPDDPTTGKVRLRPVTVATLMLVTRAARDEPGLVPVLLVKEALVEPSLSVDQVRGLHIGLLHFLVSTVNTISGLSPDGDVLAEGALSPMSRVHVLLGRYFGWSPEQVAQLTPGQVAIYLAGIEQLLKADGTTR